MMEETNRRRWRRRAILVAGMGAGIAIACYLLQGGGVPAVFDHPETGGSAMNGRAGSGAAQRPAEIPRMDVDQPAATEIATFAMG